MQYVKTAEGKAAYETAMQAWWERNRFNARASIADLIPLTPGTAQVNMSECFACRCNDHSDPRFPHCSLDCPITPKIPRQESSW